jgi:hypothetical protein
MNNQRAANVVNLKPMEKQPQILRLRLPQKTAANFAQDDNLVVMRSSDSQHQ